MLARRLALMLPLIVVFLILDQGTKIWAVHNLAGQPPTDYLGIFRLTYAENTGAWGSLGAMWNPTVRWLVLGVFPALLLLGLVYYALTQEDIVTWEVVAYGLILAGGAGNLLDRFRLGHVVDFLYIGYGRIGTNIFNIADAILMVGIGILLVRSFQQKGEPEDGV